ncbi:hypothetical protein L6Q79_16005 [bacterium]|nr:hypothetical protein [bacterium]
MLISKIPLPIKVVRIKTKLYEYSLLELFKKITIDLESKDDQVIDESTAFIGRFRANGFRVKPFKKYFGFTGKYGLKIVGDSENTNEGTDLRLIFYPNAYYASGYIFFVVAFVIMAMQESSVARKEYLFFVIFVLQSLILIPFLQQVKKICDEVKYRIHEIEP